MVTRATLSRFLVWFLVVASTAASTYATSGPKVLHPAADTSIHPQAGCRCCNFVYQKPFIQCGRVCCVDGCC
ncbi:hypothetical protein HanPI659440_Chr16g0642261 [Helianthus annuus]|nr:hypothetical protein HanPI659440_Chr16g0642261 [Helianthus annuus]